MPMPSYSRTELKRAVQLSRSFREVHKALGRGRRNRFAWWCKEWDISTEHFVQERRRYTKEMLAPLVEKSKSYAEVARKIGLKPHGGSQAHVKGRIVYFGLSVSHFSGKAWSRGRIFSGRRKSWKEMLVLRAKNSWRRPHDMLKRAMLESGIDCCCAECGLRGEWQERPIELTIDHINGDPCDDRRENIRFLCPNCHSQTPTFTSRKRKPIGDGTRFETGRA